MSKLISLFGKAAALLGVGICALAGLLRIVGMHHVLGFETVTLFIGGIALMLMGCLAKLYRDDFA